MDTLSGATSKTLAAVAVWMSSPASNAPTLSAEEAAGIADRCEIQLAYAIGVAKPLSVNVETFGTGRIPPDQIADLIDEHFDLRPGAIIRDLQLRRYGFQLLGATFVLGSSAGRVQSNQNDQNEWCWIQSRVHPLSPRQRLAAHSFKH